MKAQVIYDLANQTAWVSGHDMHKLLFRLTGEYSPSGKLELNPSILEDEVYKDKELAGLLMGLATFGQNAEVRDFLENYMKWSLGYHTPEYA
jgi:hypothetical protein